MWDEQTPEAAWSAGFGTAVSGECCRGLEVGEEAGAGDGWPAFACPYTTQLHPL